MGNTTDRRGFLGRAALGAASIVGGVAAAGLMVDAAAHADPGPQVVPPPAPPRVAHEDQPAAPDAAVRAFLGPIGPGTVVGAWTIAQIHGVFRGALPFVLAHGDGRRVQIDLMAACASSPPGVAATRTGQLYLVNRGRGAALTPPDLEAATHALATQLAAREAIAALPLASFAERHRRHPGGIFVIAL
jgi:hypothetical protein